MSPRASKEPSAGEKQRAAELVAAKEQPNNAKGISKAQAAYQRQLDLNKQKYTKGMEFGNSPDRFNDTALSPEPPRLEYHLQQENVDVRKPKQVTGASAVEQSRDGVWTGCMEEHTGMENIVGTPQTLEGERTYTTPSGTAKRMWAQKVDTLYRDDQV